MEGKDYEYGFGPEASGIGRLLSPLMPFRREVEKPYEERIVESPAAGQVERVVTPGQYGDVEAAVPEALQGLASFKGLLRDPEARAAVMEALSSAPDALQGLVRRMGISGEAALAGEERVYDPKTGQVVGAEELMLSVPAMMSPATAAMTAGETGAVFGMMGSSNVSGRFKKAVDDAEKMFNEGRREDAIYRRTGVIRTTENKPGVFIPIHGEGGLKFDKFKEYVENDLIPETASGREPSRKLGEVIEWDNGFEAYPELKDKEVVFWPASSSPIFELARGEKEGGAPVLYNATTDSFVVKTGFGGKPSFFGGGPERHFSAAIQDYISQKEGFVRPASTDLSQALSPQGFRAKVKAREMLANEEIPSPRLQYEAAQARYPYDIEQATRSPLGLQRESVFSSYTQEEPDRYQAEVMEAYSPEERRVYPVNMGALRGDLPNIEPPPVTYESPLFGVVETLKQDKGTGDQFLAQIQKSGVKQEDLEYMGLEPFLRGRKSVTKQDILDHMEERKVPIQEQYLPNWQHTKSYLVSKGPDGEDLSLEAKPRDFNTLALTVPTDPISGIAANRLTAGIHDGLPDNTVAHARFNTRTLRVDGKPVQVLFIDEIQSDWHQRAKRRIKKEEGVPAIVANSKKEGITESPDISPAALKREAYSAQAAGSVPDAPFKDNWYELTFRRLVQEAVEAGLSGVAFTTDAMQTKKYGRSFGFYDNVVKRYAEKYAKKHGTKLGTAKIGLKNGEGMDTWYMPITKEMEDLYRKPIPQYANGGGVAALVPRANAMFNTPVIRRGMGAFAPYTSRRA